MSTKTSIKRIALVAVSALGFGLLSSVAPAMADETAVTSITAGTAGPARVGATTYLPFTLNDSAAGLADDDTVTVSAKFLADGGKPTSSSADIDIWKDGNAGSEEDDATAADLVLNNDSTGNNVLFSKSTAWNADSANTSVKVNKGLSFTPDVAGTYKIVLWVDAAAGTDGTLDAGEKTASWTITTAGAPASFTVTNVGQGTAANQISGTAFGAGALLKIVPKDSAGNVARLTSDEYLTVSASDGSVFSAAGAGTYSTAITSIAHTSQQVDGSFYVNVAATSTTANKTVIFTVTGGGGISTSVSTTSSVSSKLLTQTTIGAVTNEGTTGISGLSLAAAAGGTDTADIAPDHSITYNVDAVGSELVAIAMVTDTNGAITGLVGGQYTMATTSNASTATADASDAYFSVSGTFAVGQGYVISFNDLAAGTTTMDLTLTAAARAADATTITPDPVRAAKGGTVTLTAEVVDQFGDAVAGVNTAWTVSGRNTKSTATNALTNADGLATYTYTDSGTSDLADTVSVASPAATATVNWTAATEVSTVLLTTPNTTSTGADEYPVDAEDITAGAAGATSGAVSAVATVKDANGNVLQGVPVTFTISGTGAAVKSTTATVYTGAAGTATASVYAWIAGTYTVTATAGGKSDTAPVIFAQETATEARTISATVSGSSITAVVKDRYGNTIESVGLKATRVSGAGSFAGSSSATGTTDSSGSVEFIISGGDASVKVTFNDANAATYGQSDALKGLVDGTTATNIFTATTAGTSTTAETGVGASYDAAGVNSVTVDVTSTGSDASIDAANEATDAANAATDAANAAAEAADAATAAAQDAQAAVAALATSVASLIAGIKAQITTLTNLVIKIQKKVKA